MLKIGMVVDNRYKILREIGRGGTSCVYLAENMRLHNYCAIKEVYKGGIIGEDASGDMLIAESSLLTKLRHPGLPFIYDILNTPDSCLAVMEYIEGVSLDKVLAQQGVCSEKDVVKWGKQLCDVLSYLHSQHPPIIYRDMKPANIMLKPDGSIVLIDFGIAREFKEQNQHDTAYLGTHGYAAPEQYDNKRQTDVRADIYSLGVTLYHLVTGHDPCKPPYKIDSIRAHNPALSGQLDAIIQKCICLEPKDRFQSAAALNSALETIGDAEGVTTVLCEKPEEKNRNKWLWPLALVIVGIAIIALLLFLGGQRRSAADTSPSFSIETKAPMNTKTTTPVTESTKGSQADLSCRGITLDTDMVILSKAGDSHLLSFKLQPANTKDKVTFTSENPEVATVSDKGNITAVAEGETRIIIRCGAIENVCTVYCQFEQESAKPAVKPVVVTMPDLQNKIREEAEKELQDLGFGENIQIEEENNDNFKKGAVIRTVPEKDTTLTQDTQIIMVVSLGKKIQFGAMPNVVGETKEKAEATIKNQGLDLQVVVEEVFDPSVAKGVVVETVPGRGEKLQTNDTVILKISKGVEMKKMPALVGLSLDDAKAKLKSLGFKEPVVRSVAGKKAKNTVVAQLPKADIEYDLNTEIILEVSDGSLAPKLIKKNVIIDLKGYALNDRCIVSVKRDGVEVLVAAVPKGTTFVELTEQEGLGTVYYTVLIDESEGWIHTEEFSESDKGGATAMTGTISNVMVEVLVRSGPGTEYAKAGTLPLGERVTISELKYDDTGMQWGKTPVGWVRMDFVKLD